jgi:tetratricopeptide (TPR) repeat protein
MITAILGTPSARQVGHRFVFQAGSAAATVTQSFAHDKCLNGKECPCYASRMATFDTFISYSHKDKTTADATCAALEAVGIRCWIAPRDIVSGMDWGEAIIDAIMGARIMVLIFSGSSNISPQVKREVERAVHRGIPVIPLRLEQVPMSKSLEYFLSTSHWLDALTPPLEKHLQHLTESVRTLLKRVGAEINGPDVTEPAGSTSPRPITPVAFNNRGTAFFNRRDYDRAIAEFDEAIRLDPNFAAAFYGRGCAYDGKGDYDRAIKDYDEAIRLNPKDAAFFSNRGTAYWSKSDCDRAIPDYDEAIRLSPNEATYFSNRANAYKKKGELDRAMKDYDEAIRLNPKNATFFVNRAGLFQDRRDYDHAIKDYDEAIRLNPRYANALYGQGSPTKTRASTSKPSRAMTTSFLSVPNMAKALYQRSEVKRSMHDDAGADADLQAAIAIDPNVGL